MQKQQHRYNTDEYVSINHDMNLLSNEEKAILKKFLTPMAIFWTYDRISMKKKIFLIRKSTMTQHQKKIKPQKTHKYMQSICFCEI
jgi:phosphoenolpyruvate synthase/pyruvate phosphate dikinase